MKGVDRDSSITQLAYFTVGQYFLNIPVSISCSIQFLLSEAKIVVASTCLEYLSISDFE
jgi:hypothetical protein